ncbi:hypothetical protein [Beggiatoa leptomitoformis]|uniref:Dynamin family protein n=1 Tax=Beggiatoa leptomitoformis TaxID=288004 RepID=A0A2N9YFF9_9GAMM|nr:hypothetical protein [Beggiatoa leptomitoformis]ALG68453.1 hypothetical protein AL038_13040 [Beggiatoa leptomitoformis]AUI69214.1 hypothetical protein BLE401_11230 [Beggiatoa leptomitoformis]
MSIQDKQREFTVSLQSLVKYIQNRLDEIESNFEKAKLKEPACQEVYSQTWKPRLKKLRDKAEQLQRLTAIRPSLCVMGKQNQGKTSLLQSWLGNAIGGIQEMSYLPVGDSDTTACLVRLTKGSSFPDEPSTHYLHVELFPTDFEPTIQRPTLRLQKKTIRLLRTVDEPIRIDKPFHVCRFPVLPEDDDFYLEEHNHLSYKISETGNIQLSDIQWHIKQVTIPVALPAQKLSIAEQTIDTLDIIDAPGADSMNLVGNYSEWKKTKNTAVFTSATHEIDVLLIVCSSDPAAMAIGGQFQDTVWSPWQKRCQGQGNGRLLLSFTHAAVLFKKISNTLKKEDTEREIAKNPNQSKEYVKNYAETNFYSTIFKNVISPLMSAERDEQPLISTDLATWPPIFFFERHEEDLEQFDIQADCAEQVSSQLCQRLEEYGDAAHEDSTLPWGERCVLRLVKDWSDCNVIDPSERRCIQKWLIHVLVALLDPNNRGFKLFTKTITNYATVGPIANNHCSERKRHADDLCRQFDDFLSEINQPQNRINAINELNTVKEFLKSIWVVKDGLLGIQPFRLGNVCRSRIASVEETIKNPLSTQPSFEYNDIIQDVVDDAVDQLKAITSTTADVKDKLKRALKECLIEDYALVMFKKHNEYIIKTKVERLKRLQSICLERLVRVMAYLVDADKNALEQVAKFCYGEDKYTNILISTVLNAGAGHKQTADKEQFERVATATDSLLAEIKQANFKSSYE